MHTGKWITCACILAIALWAIGREAKSWRIPEQEEEPGALRRRVRGRAAGRQKADTPAKMCHLLNNRHGGQFIEPVDLIKFNACITACNSGWLLNSHTQQVAAGWRTRPRAARRTRRRAPPSAQQTRPRRRRRRPGGGAQGSPARRWGAAGGPRRAAGTLAGRRRARPAPMRPRARSGASLRSAPWSSAAAAAAAGTAAAG